MIGAYLGFTGRRVGMRPEDRNDAEIHEAPASRATSAPGAGGR